LATITFLPQKSNSDLCCSIFSEAEEFESFSAARIARAALIF
jgi:hypothetical protein